MCPQGDQVFSIGFQYNSDGFLKLPGADIVVVK